VTSNSFEGRFTRHLGHPFLDHASRSTYM